MFSAIWLTILLSRRFGSYRLVCITMAMHPRMVHSTLPVPMDLGPKYCTLVEDAARLGGLVIFDGDSVSFAAPDGSYARVAALVAAFSTSF